MQLQFTGDGKGFELRLKGTWRSIIALIAAIVLVGSTSGIQHLGTLLSWW